jgi:alpha-N-arabinofuranosidase
MVNRGESVITCHATIDPEFIVAPVTRRLFGSLVEHMGRCVYEGIFDPGSPYADHDGLRRDVRDLVRELGVGVVRYPGGNFVSGYDWEDGIGPVPDRPARLNLAWRSIEPNTFGLNEFMQWTKQVGAEPMLAVNLGTRGIADAANLLEYTNHPGDTRYSDLRRTHGRHDPYSVKLWCLGNEMDGPWQLGHKGPDEYGQLAAATANAMRRVDPSIELVVCGSSHPNMPTLGRWEASVLEHAYDAVDYISMHGYYAKTDDDRVGYLASSDAMDDFIEGIIATCDHMALMKRSKRRLRIAFDEWNVETRVPEQERSWEYAPRISEDVYGVDDAVVVGNLLISLLRHSDRVAIACLAQLVNVMAPIRAERDAKAWRQTTFYPFALTARHARGAVLRVEPRSTSPIHSPTRGDVQPAIVTATLEPDTGALMVLASNRCIDDAVSLEISIIGGAPYRVIEHTVIGGQGRDVTNTGQYRPQRSEQHHLDGERLRVHLPAASWTMLRLSKELAPSS